MQRLCDTTGVTLHQTVLAAVALLLTVDNEGVDVVLGAPYLNRRGTDARVIGNFVDALPIRVIYSRGSMPSRFEDEDLHFLNAVQRSSQASLAYALPYHQILGSIFVPDALTEIPNDPLIETVVTMRNASASSKISNIDIPSARPLPVWGEGAKFKLMCEFWAIGGNLLKLRVEWDESVVGSREDMNRWVRLLERALNGLVSGVGFEKNRSSLTALSEQMDKGDEEGLTPSDAFGKSMRLESGGEN